MADKGILGMTEDAFEQLRQLAGSTNVIGEAIETQNGTTILPVCRVNLGYTGGGMDFSDEKGASSGRVAGGTGGGLSMTPVAFLTVSPTGGVSLLQIADKKKQSMEQRAMNLLPGFIQQITDVIEKKTGISAPRAEEEVDDVDWDAYVSTTPTATVYDVEEVVDTPTDTE